MGSVWEWGAQRDRGIEMLSERERIRKRECRVKAIIGFYYLAVGWLQRCFVTAAPLNNRIEGWKNVNAVREGRRGVCVWGALCRGGHYAQQMRNLIVYFPPLSIFNMH